MNIKIGKKIKKLRKEQEVTQEKLAEYLGISYQAVSKWENGTALPDITLVPALSNFFGVSSDELFSIGSQVKDEKISEYEVKCKRLGTLGDVKGEINLMRKALEEYPRNYQFMINLAYALVSYNSTGEQDNECIENRYVDEAIKLCERILEDCREDYIRHSAIQILCTRYPKYGKSLEAKKLADTMPPMAICKEMLLEHILMGEDKIEQKQDNMLRHIDNAANSLITLSYNKLMGNELSIEQKISFIEAANKLYEAIIPDGNYLFYNCRLAWNYRIRAELCCAMGEKSEAVKTLRTAAKFAENYDNLPEACKYTSIFINRCEQRRELTSKNWVGTECSMLYDKMNEPVFDSIREFPEFKELLERLRNAGVNQ